MFGSNLQRISKFLVAPLRADCLTVKPLDRVVDSVFTPFFTTGVAKPLLSGDTVLRPARPRSPWVRFKANRRDAMGVVSGR
jgi:hypothetical protein